MRETHRALSRALSFWCGSTHFDVERFFHRATWELHHVLESDVTAMAFVIRRGDGSYFVGRSRDHQALPAETLLGMLVEKHGERLGCRVRDHALDTVRFLDQRFRTSVIVGIEVPHGLVSGAEGAIWFGLPGGAHPGFVSTAEEMGREVSEWLSWYGGTLEATMRVASERAQDGKRLEEMRALLHDARAPLGVLKYMTRGDRGDELISSMRQELDYLDAILSQGAPRVARGAVTHSCEVGEILRKVYRRYAREDGGEAISLDVGYRSFYARFPALELERIVTNLVSNARRHAPHAQTRVGAEEEANTLVVYVYDNGPGIPAEILRALHEGSRVPSGGESGWGVGLQSCIAKARELGGEISIASPQGDGTCVRVVMPRGEVPLEARRLEVADGGMVSKGQERLVDVCVVDDDKEHGRSLSRLLRNFGLRVGESESLESFLRDFENDRVSSVLCDAHMPDGGAERLLPILAASAKAPPLAVVSGDTSDDQLYRLAALGAQAFFTKPVDVDEVVAWVRQACG